MNYIYGIIIKHPKKENYGFPFQSLEIIDQIMTSKTKEELLNDIKRLNIIPYLNDESNIAVGIMQNKKWIERKIIPTITDSYIINYPFEKIFLNNPHELANYLYNQLVYLVNKNFISNEFKKTILALKTSYEDFLNDYQNLAYYEKRLIRYTLNKKINIKNEKDNILLKRTKDIEN